jgi:hypothetical protein
MLHGLVGCHLSQGAHYLNQRIGSNAVREIIGQTGKARDVTDADEALSGSDEIFAVGWMLEKTFQELCKG